MSEVIAAGERIGSHEVRPDIGNGHGGLLGRLRAMALTAYNRNAFMGQVEMSIADQLVGGATPDQVVSYWETRGLSPRQCWRYVRRVEQSPVMPAARRLAMTLACRHWLYGEYARLEEDLPVPVCVDRISLDEFQRQYFVHHRPLVVRQAAGCWPAINKWTDEYLKDVVGKVKVNVMAGRNSARAEDQYAGVKLVREIQFAEFIDQVSSCGPSNDHYLVAKNEFFASDGACALAADVGELSFVETACRPSDAKLWFGPGGTHTPFHYDSRDSVLVQIRGVKLVKLISPWYSAHIRQSEPWYADAGWTPTNESGQQIREGVATLGPGDALFIPVGWWHDVQAIDVSLSLTFLQFKCDSSAQAKSAMHA
jgi:hypothetical protein